MAKCKVNRKRLVRHLGMILVGSLLLLAACNLGPQAPPQPVTQEPLGQGGPPVSPLDLPTATETPLIQIAATATPLPELMPWETLGPITIEGDKHRTQDPITVRVQYGRSVSTITCSWVLQDTGETKPLETPTTTQIDDNTFNDVYTFTPEKAGTYVVNCTGVALTTGGQRAVSAAGTPFAVEAKG